MLMLIVPINIRWVVQEEY